MTEAKTHNLGFNYRPRLTARLGVFFSQLNEAFCRYIRILELQEKEILENSDNLVLRNQQEQAALGGILALHQSIVPLEELYLSGGTSADASGNFPFAEQKDELERLREKALKQQEKNRQLAESQLSLLKEQLSQTKNRMSGLRRDSRPQATAQYLNITA